MTMKKLFLTLLCVVFLSAAPAPAMADVDRSVNLSVLNDSAYAWEGFHFFVFEYPEEFQYPFFNYDITNVSFVDSGPLSPDSSQSSLTWEKSEDGKELDLFFLSDLVQSGETASFSVDILNPDMVLHGVGFVPIPVVVPEPVSSALFLIGGAMLGFRRFRKTITN